MRTAGPVAIVAIALASLLPTSARAQAEAEAEAAAVSSTGFTIAADLRSAAFCIPGAPSVIVHAPPGFDARAPLHLVIFLHGYSGCVSVLMGKGEAQCRPQDEPREGWDLGAHHDAAGTNSLLVVPQLGFMKRNGRPGAFGKQGGFRAFLQELLAETLAPQLGGPRKLEDVASLTLVAHSAGYETALAILEHGEVDAQVHAIVLMDALYGGREGYLRFVLSHASRGLRLVALHLDYGKPRIADHWLYKQLLRRLGPERVVATDAAGLPAAVAAFPFVIASGTPPHRLLPEHHLQEILAALGLPSRSAH